MAKNRDGPRFYKKHSRVIALALAVVMLGTIALSGIGVASRVTINGEEDLGNPAANALLRTTDYINKSPGERMRDQIGLLRGTQTLADYYTLACSQIAREQFASALMNINKCIELYSETVEETGSNAVYLDLWLKKACLEVMIGDYGAALLSLDKVLEADDMVSDAYLVRAQVYAALQDIPAMSESLVAYLELVPEDEQMRSLLAQAILAQSEFDAAQQGAGQSAPPSAEMQYLNGLYALQDGDYSNAERALTGAIRMNPDFEGLYYFRGVCRLTLMDYDGAAEDFLETIRRGYMVHTAYYNLGIARILSDAYDEGLADIETAAAMDEDPSIKTQAEEFLTQVSDIEAEAELMEFLVKAQACSDQSDFIGMSEYLDQYLAKVPEDSGIREVFAQGLFVSEQYSKAMEQYQTLISEALVRPDWNGQAAAKAEPRKLAEYYYLYGLSAIQLSEFSKAEQALSDAIARYSGNEGTYYYRGVCRLSLGFYKEAMDDFDSSVKRGEMIHSCIYNRGICKLMLEDYEGGMADVKLAASMSDDPEVSGQADSLLKELTGEKSGS